jgi:DNA-binding response OmpR family regulator
MKKILVVDDEEGIRVLYGEELRDEGFIVQGAANAEEALAALDSFCPDLIILDIMLPDMSGLTLMQHIRARFRDLPIILSSAYPEYRQDIESWASDAYVVKSSNLETLKAAVRNVLGAELAPKR